jgi:deferrochelatase/peroxidase EfeB
MKDGAASQLTTQKDRATEGLGTLAHAVRQTTERLRDEQHGTIAEYAERAAEQLERFSDNLRQKDVSELLRDAQRFARRQPALFIGGSFVAGLLIARFLKSSRESSVTTTSALPGAY